VIILGLLTSTLFDQHQDNLFHPIRNKAVTAGQHESGAQQARVEAKAHYVAWMSQKDGPSLVRKTIFRDVFRQDSRKRFDEACQSSGCVLASKLTILTARNLKKRCCDLHTARLHFINYLSGDADVRYTTNETPLQYEHTKGAGSHLLSTIRTL